MKSQLSLTLFLTLMSACAIDEGMPPDEETGEGVVEEDEPEEATDEEIQNGAVTAAYPAVGALTIKKSAGTYTCTATIVSPTKMITAAHCIVGALSVEARFGSNMANPTARFKATGWTVHPQFNINNIAAGNDYAVVTFGSSALSTNRAPMKLRVASINSIGSRVIVGYGLTSNAGGAGTKRAGAATVDSDNDKHLRMKATGTAVHSCSGDSGGPMLHKINGVNYVIGVSSYGNGTCDARTLAYYADLTAATQWLKNQGL